MREESVQVAYPSWVQGTIDWQRLYRTDQEKMALAIELSRLNIRQQSGAPCGAAIFRCETGALIAVGLSQVVRQNNSVLHAEVVAIMLAEQRLQAYNLRVGGLSHPARAVRERRARDRGHRHAPGRGPGRSKRGGKGEYSEGRVSGGIDGWKGRDKEGTKREKRDRVFYERGGGLGSWPARWVVSTFRPTMLYRRISLF